MRRVNVYVLAIAVILGGIAAYMARNVLERQAFARGSATGTVVVTAVPLSFGAELTRDSVKEVVWTAGALPEGAFANRDELFKGGRRVVLTPMERGEFVLVKKITGAGQRATLSALLDPGMRAVTVRVDDVRGVAGFVLPGDRVDVVLIRQRGRGGGENESYSEIVVENVKVLAVDQVANERQEKAKVAKAVTVEASIEESQKILLGSTVGRLALILRQAGEANPALASRVSESDLGNRPRNATEASTANVVEAIRAKVEVIRGVARSVYNVAPSVR